MRALGEIPIRVETSASLTPSTGTIGGGVRAILSEIAARLERLAAGGEPEAVDLRSMPMSPTDREQLWQALGTGEVVITLQVDGDSTIRETAVRGVWWNEFRDGRGELVAEFIEVAPVPGILPVQVDEMRQGANRLRARSAG